VRSSNTGTTMRVVQFDNYGPPEVLHIAEADPPVPGAGQLQIRVAAVGVNPADFKWRSGMLRGFVEVQLPHVVGYDVAGTVTTVGEGVTGFTPGERVAATVQRGYAEIAVADASACAKVPESLDLTVAAGIPCPGLTGVQMIEELVRPREGQTVLITGATGGVGRFAVHAALSMGARVVAAVRPSQFDEARKIGAHAVIPLETGGADSFFDHVADTVGGPAVASLCLHVVPGGTICTVSTTPIDPKDLPAEPKFFAYHPDGVRLEKLLKDVSAGLITMPIARKLPLAMATEAHRLVEAGGLGGKVILEP
jgi:NADPH:quinone reductase-like Zn-dependent oxidoreductase